MRVHDYFDGYRYELDHAYFQSDYGLYGRSRSASDNVNKQHHRYLVTGFQQCSYCDLYVHAECRSMCCDDYFGCYGYCVDHANVQSYYRLYWCG